MDISTPKERDQLWNQAPQGLTHFKAKSLLPWSTEPRFWMCATPTWVFHTQKGLSLWFLRCLWSHVSCSSVLFGSSFLCVSYLHCSCYYFVQVAHFVTPFCFDNLEPLHASLNGILPPDIRIREIAPVHPDFHARHSACRKTYQYKAVVAPVMEPFRHNYAYHIRHRLNIAAMQEAASYFVGVHNFSAFANASSDSTVRSVVRELLRFSVVYTVCTSAIWWLFWGRHINVQYRQFVFQHCFHNCGGNVVYDNHSSSCV